MTRLTEQERTGQLLMVGVSTSAGAASAEPAVREHRVGGVVYLGGWRDSSTVAAASAALQQRATRDIGLLVAADQEGGQIQQLRGGGFSTLPAAVDQGRMAAGELTAMWAAAGRELRAAGVNVNLAPVADVVAKGQEGSNAPIGRYSRQLGSDPGQVGHAVRAVVAGLSQGGVQATVKHFPGLGRVTGNTDVTAQGITDETTGPTDPYLEPFRGGIEAGAGLVMVSSARYPKLDPANQAVFSPAVITGLLRGAMGYQGVVISDDVGVAESVTGVPAGERATRFLASGGDVVLTAQPSTVSTMSSAITARARQDPTFAEQVHRSVSRVLALKDRMGLLHCG